MCPRGMVCDVWVGVSVDQLISGLGAVWWVCELCGVSGYGCGCGALAMCV